MNFLLLLPDEIQSDGIAVVKGERARAMQREYDLEAGISLAGGVLEGKRGRVEIIALGADCVRLRTSLTEDPLPRYPTIVIVAVPRPQTVKKVLSTASAMGVSELHFVRADNVEKSYLSSHALHADEIDQEVRLGLQQSGDTHAPKIEVHQRFKPFFEDRIPELLATSPYKSDPLLLFGHTRDEGQSCGSLAAVPFGASSNRGVVFAIGPEAGWSDYEAEFLAGRGFKPITLGPRTLRVETALAVFLGEIELLRGMASSP